MKIDVTYEWLEAYVELDIHRQLMENTYYAGDWDVWLEQEKELIRLQNKLATYFN